MEGSIRTEQFQREKDAKAKQNETKDSQKDVNMASAFYG
jgi:hypothetical protein